MCSKNVMNILLKKLSQTLRFKPNQNLMFLMI